MTQQELSLEAMPVLAAELLESAGNRKVISFSGGLGAGKTTFIKAICRYLGVEDHVSSPTFSIVNEYRLPDGQPVYHFDLYRIENPTELYELGFEEYFYSGYYCFIEWPEKAARLIPGDYVKVDIHSDGSKRFISFQ